jgi:FAD/FMN-containing dehydrogenase
MSTKTANPAAVTALRERLSCPVLGPADAGYAQACAAWNTGVEHHPLAVVTPQDVDDVVAALAVAHGHGLPVAVQATGRGACRRADGALLVVTSALRGVDVDPKARTVTVAAGVPWGEVLAATAEHGLVPALGSSPGVGVVGYALGGGLGWFARAWGTGADGVTGVDVVLPDGTLTRTDPTTEPELFGALRGAGAGTFGVVVSVTLALHELSEVYAGNLWYPAEQALEVGRRWREWSDDAPDELTTALVLMTYPDAAYVPEPLRGGAFVLVRGAWCGPVADGEALVDVWREWAEPVLDEWSARPVTEIGEVSHDPVDPLPMVGTTELLDELTDEALEAFVDGWGYGPNGELRVLFGEVRRLGGAVRRLGADAVDAPLRSAEFALWYATTARNDAQRRRVTAHLAAVRAALAPHVTGGVFLNFAQVDEKAARTPHAFGPDAWERLRALKARLDPDDRFRFGFAVPPAVEDESPPRTRVPAQARSDEDDATPDPSSPPREQPVSAVPVPRPAPPRPPVPADDLPEGYVSPGFVVPPVVVHPALEQPD